MVEILALSLLRVPNLLRNSLAEPRIDLDISELQFLVNVAEVLTVEDGKDVALGEEPLAEETIEALIAIPQRTCRSLCRLKTLDPFELLLAFRLLGDLLPLSASDSHQVIIH